MHITQFKDWPQWVQVVVVGPNAILAAIMCWIWWPKNGREWKRFGYLLLYLIVFFAILHFVFGLK